MQEDDRAAAGFLSFGSEDLEGQVRSEPPGGRECTDAGGAPKGHTYGLHDATMLGGGANQIPDGLGLIALIGRCLRILAGHAGPVTKRVCLGPFVLPLLPPFPSLSIAIVI